ncbi:transcriptional regulator [Marmoricola endophyticus]|uniref:Transcriptional regulator n=1 Tax=Marmoricola endophyticus TaxID=2040280 RepID=A0A917BNY5_9ACTN|nr:LCP family protein [Marmoricola endophyticus]GGF52216.1 transcriptional regulator [Marmoricola endophyticus]
MSDTPPPEPKQPGHRALRRADARREQKVARTSGARVRRVLKRVSVVVVVLALILGGVFAYFYKHLEGNINQLSVSDALGKRPDKVGSGGPLNVLVMGSDTRKGQGKAVKGSTPGLSDTTILLHLSANRKRAYGISIPRDAMVERPSCQRKDGKGSDPGGLTQFNAAYAVGGPACTIKTVESISDVYIDHFVVIDFNGFRTMVDALGGVQVCVPEKVDDDIGDIHLRKGTYNVTGEQALDYVRVRHALSTNGDIGRMRRQQTFVAAMISKAVSAGTLANPVKLVRFLNAATNALTTDPGFAKLSDLASLGSSLKNIGLGNVQFLTVPFQEYAPDPNRVELSPDADEVFKRIRNDQPLSRSTSEEAVKASDSTPSTGRKGPAVGKARSAVDVAAAAGRDRLEKVEEQTQQKQQRAEDNGLCA